MESQDIPVGNFFVCDHSHPTNFLPSACSESKGSCSRREEDGRKEKSGAHLSLCSLLSSSSGIGYYQDSRSNLRWLQLSGLPEHVSSLPLDPRWVQTSHCPSPAVLQFHLLVSSTLPSPLNGILSFNSLQLWPCISYFFLP